MTDPFHNGWNLLILSEDTASRQTFTPAFELLSIASP
jgi:hypothetical protein